MGLAAAFGELFFKAIFAFVKLVFRGVWYLLFLGPWYLFCLAGWVCLFAYHFIVIAIRERRTVREGTL